MNLSSTKNRSTINSKAALASSFVLATVLVLGSVAQAASKYSYQLTYDARYGVHTVGEPNVATNRHNVEYEQKTEYSSQWLTVFGVRAEVEAAYASLPDRYGKGDVAKYESQTFFARDIYAQYKNGAFRARLGFQQVVWGESFGNYYADIVNPKDYRNAALGDLSRNRLAIPMINLQWIYSDSSFQVIYIPRPMFNMVPSSGSDFNNLLLPAAISNLPLTIDKTAANPPTAGEYGFRYGKQLSGFDMSVFYFNYFDRMPVYSVAFLPAPVSIRATPDYKPLQSAGATLTVDIDGFLLRTEVIQHLDREYNTLQGFNVGTAKSNELVYVVGLDMPPRDKWQAGVQFSESRLSEQTWLLRRPTQSTLSGRVSKQFENEVEAQALMTYFTSDASRLLQASVSIPLSSQSELLFGADLFSGDASSELGRFQNASRAWAMFKTTLKK